jgi:pimeloyl-ACP methyl ester carboxylesterase
MQKEIILRGKKLTYSIYGTGKPVMLLHGFAEDHRIWQHQVNSLSAHYQLIIPDLPGSGQSDLSGDMSMEAMAADMQELLLKHICSHFAEKKVAIIGHSMGGYIALAFAQKYPELTAGIGLIHSTAYADGVEKKQARQRGIEFIRNRGSSEFLQQSIPNLFSEQYRIHNPAVIKKLIEQYKDFDDTTLIIYYEKMMQRTDKTPLLATTNKPVLFIIGKHDTAVPYEQSLRQCHLPSLSYIHILKNSAHMGLWEEHTKTNAAITSFLQDVYVS